MRVSLVKENLVYPEKFNFFEGFSFCNSDAGLHLRGSEGRRQGGHEEGRTQWRSRGLLEKRPEQPRGGHGHGQPRRRVRQEGLCRPLLSQVILTLVVNLYLNSGFTRDNNKERICRFQKTSSLSVGSLHKSPVTVIRTMKWTELLWRDQTKNYLRRVIDHSCVSNVEVHKTKALSLTGPKFKFYHKWKKLKWLFKGNCKEKTLCPRENLGSPALVSATSRN